VRKKFIKAKTLCKGKAAKTGSARVLSINPKNLPFKKPVKGKRQRESIWEKNPDN